ncbi:hypothetical protein Bca52824_060353 [Brassica carinata]|uniref:Phorbol-ester/DAG-type domain-containing protein n=1 Tax=Brassica carinata TaxID=52824 RepID=A0A8X7QYD3_BRACI|nr:hypothetical protein Bca52824_060353 [Brassica carinata]
MSSIDNPPPSSFTCLVVNERAVQWFPKKTVGETTYLIISDVQYEDTLNSHHLRSVLGCNNKEGERSDHYCWACRSYKTGTTYFYYCNECNNYYHKECVESPPIFISSYHPKYPLQLLKYDRGIRRECLCCGLEIYGLVYHSSISDLFMDPLCASKQEFSTIHNPERHEHTLHYFPRKAPITCDVCASDDTKNCFYSCLQCDFIVHGRCINLPHVIRISCHSHRLSFTSSLPFGNSWFCGVCSQKMDENYGSYSCTKSCTYAVHTNCATLLDIWAGKELKDQPELEDDNIKPSFEEMGDGIIRHFRHAHHRMKFIEDIGVFDAKQQHCQACIFPLYDGNVYTCMECDFFLHGTLPYKVKYDHDEHMLTLSYEKIASGPCWCQICEETTDPKKGYYTCSECRVTFHTECVLGNDIYLKEGNELYTYYGRKVEIILNNRLSRPICHGCRKRCQYNIVFKNYLGNIFCSSMEPRRILGRVEREERCDVHYLRENKKMVVSNRAPTAA